MGIRCRVFAQCGRNGRIDRGGGLRGLGRDEGQAGTVSGRRGIVGTDRLDCHVAAFEVRIVVGDRLGFAAGRRVGLHIANAQEARECRVLCN